VHPACMLNVQNSRNGPSWPSLVNQRGFHFVQAACQFTGEPCPIDLEVTQDTGKSLPLASSSFSRC
jgi:hypothetical protein